MKGQEAWKLEDDSLDDPNGIANDPSGNVFVIGRTSKNMIPIQHDGKTYKRFLNVDDFSYPQAVCYNADKKHSLVNGLNLVIIVHFIKYCTSNNFGTKNCSRNIFFLK